MIHSISAVRLFTMTADILYPPVVLRGSSNASVLLGGTPEEQALVDQWIHFADTEVHAFSVLLYVTFSHRLPYSKLVRAWFSSFLLS